MRFVVFTHRIFSLNKIGSHCYSEVATEQWGHRVTPDCGTAWEEAGGVWRDGEDHEEVWRWSAIPKKKNIAKKDPSQAPPNSLSLTYLMAINSIGPSFCVWPSHWPTTSSLSCFCYVSSPWHCRLPVCLTSCLCDLISCSSTCSSHPGSMRRDVVLWFCSSTP